MSHPLQCRCGVVQGTVGRPEVANRMVCYCRDCQAFAHFLGRAADILDEAGGSDVVQTPPANVVFTAGVESLACMRLTERGLLRWYASCCNTPIGNTPPDFRMSFVGLVSTCLRSPTRSIDDSFGPVRARAYTKHAKKPVHSSVGGMLSAIVSAITMITRARISGDYKRTPFFDVAAGTPVVTPKVLSPREHEQLYAGL
jgi:hypothetical protein